MRVLLIISLFFIVQLKAQIGLGLEYQRNVEFIRLSDFEDLLLSNSSFDHFSSLYLDYFSNKNLNKFGKPFGHLITNFLDYE